MIDLDAGLRAVAPRLPADVAPALHAVRWRVEAIGVCDAARWADLIGQCAHESAGFTRRVENLHYSARRIAEVWPRRFPDHVSAAPFAGDPEALANRVYGRRMGNDRPGDGWRYRGRGWLQLTGRDNYAEIGAAIGLPLEDKPELAADPGPAWLIAAHFFATRRLHGRTALEWAEGEDVGPVTRIVNGGRLGLEERQRLTEAAEAAIRGEALRRTLRRGAAGPAVRALQDALMLCGFPPGAIDGQFGPATEAAVRRLQAECGLAVDGVAGPRTWAALEVSAPEQRSETA